MKKPDRDGDLRAAAEDAIDDEAVAELLERLADVEVDDTAAESLNRIAADVLIATTAKAAMSSRYRFEPIDSEAIADAWQDLCGCECEEPPTSEWVWYIGVWES